MYCAQRSRRHQRQGDCNATFTALQCGIWYNIGNEKPRAVCTSQGYGQPVKEVIMDSIPHARCCKCRLEKPVTEFHKGRNPGGVASYCKTCKNKGTPRVMPKLGPRRDFTGDRNTTWTVIQWVSDEQRWLCRCDCGREKFLQGYQWHAKVGNRACTCNGTERVRLPGGEAAFNVLYGDYQAGAIRRKMVFELSKEQFRILTMMDCAYCGTPPSQKKTTSTNKNGNSYTYTGIDRVDPTQGYMWDNCKPCCRWCNTAKNSMTMAQWVEHLKRIYNHLHLGSV